jgi:hypothetical protein
MIRSLLLVLLFAAPAAAQEEAALATPGPARLGSGIGAERDFGLGIYLGEPVALSAKWWLSPDKALTFLVGGWVHPHRGTVAGADFTYHLRDLLPHIEPIELGLYFCGGVGIGVWLDERLRPYEHDAPWPHSHIHDYWEPLMYLRPVVGGALWFREAPIELSIDLAPAVLFLPAPGFELGGGMSGRYYF